MDTIRVDRMKAGDVFLLDEYKFRVKSIKEDGENIFGDPLFLLEIEPCNEEAARSYIAHRYGNLVKWQGYLNIRKPEEE